MGTKILSGIVIKGVCFFAFLMPICAQSTTANTLQHPRDQIALQLGAIQMGYTVPFTLTGNISAPKMQQAVNALVMGRNSLNATVGAPAVQVQGAVDCPNVDTVEYRDQLYSAVEYVVTSPVVATIKGSATLANSKKVTLSTTKLTVPPSAWTIPVPYALEARTSADVVAVVDAVVSAGLMSPDFSPAMITVQGGALPQGSGFAGQSVATFQIGKYEVTYGEWLEVQTWAVANGYSDLVGIGAGSSKHHPVTSVTWYDVLKWSNAKSEMEGLTPVYQVSGATYKTGQSAPTVNSAANGYRLPSEKEWEWAARGGLLSQGYTYSGSNDVNAVAWVSGNSGGLTKAVGTKTANELGIYDMSGNVWELCENCRRGGSWWRFNDFAFSGKGDHQPDLQGHDLGFRLVRNTL